MFAARQQFNFQPPASGGFGNSLFFPNTGTQYLSKPGTTGLVTWKATTGYTIEYWGYFTSFGGSINGGPGNSDGSGTNYWTFGPVTNGILEFYFWSPGTTFLTTNTNAVPLNTWVNLCAVFTTSGSTTTMSLYVNGVRQQVRLGSSSGAGTFANTQTTTAGATSAGTVFGLGKYGANTIRGWIDNLRASNINRYSGASYTLATAPFVSDANTQILIEPTGAVGSTTIPYQSVSGNGNMTNASNQVTISDTHANHT
jgi:hypothetical protein